MSRCLMAAIAGLRLEGADVFSVQYHPEASPGPMDSHYLFDRFAGGCEEAGLENDVIAAEALPVSAISATKTKIPLGTTCIVMTIPITSIICGRPTLQIRGRRHADHIEAGVDEMHFAGDTAR